MKQRHILDYMRPKKEEKLNFPFVNYSSMEEDDGDSKMEDVSIDNK